MIYETEIRVTGARTKGYKAGSCVIQGGMKAKRPGGSNDDRDNGFDSTVARHDPSREPGQRISNKRDGGLEVARGV